MNKTFVVFWVGIFILILFFWIYFPAISHYRELKMQQDLIEKELKTLDQKIQELTEERRLLESDKSYIEKVIREQMGLVRPGEVVYKFVQDKLETTPALETEKVSADYPRQETR